MCLPLWVHDMSMTMPQPAAWRSALPGASIQVRWEHARDSGVTAARREVRRAWRACF